MLNLKVDNKSRLNVEGPNPSYLDGVLKVHPQKGNRGQKTSQQAALGTRENNDTVYPHYEALKHALTYYQDQELQTNSSLFLHP
ncbi:hypothetical [Prochlorococcus marinus str. MIT 9313]|uniref:Uncharacterized protein n=1 Tax=Prochlorococcus marinus (strain MIT 9313) TaxID=74547 RepID=Q7V4A9_PROMM|nr:hypothetical [Prochlorococcus marinus str. MIT 9313]